MKRSYVSKKPKIKEEDEGKPKINNNDILSDLTKNAIESHGRLPWRTPFAVDYNPLSKNGTYYRGGNALMTKLVREEKGWKDCRWMTYKQISEAGGTVLKDSKATKIISYGGGNNDKYNKDASKEHGSDQFIESKNTSNEPEKKQRSFIFTVNIFNKEQTQGLTLDEKSSSRPEKDPYDAVKEKLGDRCPQIVIGSVDAYDPTNDKIVMLPENQYRSRDHMAWCLAVNAAYASAKPGRFYSMERDDTADAVSVAREAIRCESAGTIMMTKLGYKEYIYPEVKNSIANWSRLLEEKKLNMYKLLSDGDKISSYLLNDKSPE